MTKFEEYWQLYKERYGNSGPSISSSCKGSVAADSPFPVPHCGCWECQLVELRKKGKSVNAFSYNSSQK